MKTAKTVKTALVFFDTETNGLTAKHSVLSISALKCEFALSQKSFEWAEIGRFDRYYYRKDGEREEAGAISVNGLTAAVIKEKRGGADYPLHFYEDAAAFLNFCAGVRHFAAHNIAYDRQYLPFQLPYQFCTMAENKRVLKLRRKNGLLKFPSLAETARAYGIVVENSALHGSAYDASLVLAIFIKMLESKRTRKKTRAFLELGAEYEPVAQEAELF